ncbi:MAG: VWA domain-containing protein [Acidobacteriota bacterium]
MCRLILLLSLLAATAGAQTPPREPVSSEQITVARVLVDARVTDYAGDPILGLKAADFRVLIDGKPARVESVDWIPETAAARAIAEEMGEASADAATTTPAAEELPQQPRLLVLFFQTDFGRNNFRVSGQMKVSPFADELVNGLEPEDRVAVLSYDSHLKFRLDFTTDHRQIADAVRSAILVDDPPPPQMVPMPRLASHLDPKELRNVANPEKALTVLANALRPIPGPKSLILLGWGLGYRINGQVVMGRDYAIARRALEAARVTCFSLDITQADGHDLAAGLATAAGDTGGFYASTYLFPKMAFERLQKTLAGHYELEVRKPQRATPGVHTIDVSVPGRKKATVLARTSYVDEIEN